jgi:hypothetical protein
MHRIWSMVTTGFGEGGKGCCLRAIQGGSLAIPQGRLPCNSISSKAFRNMCGLPVIFSRLEFDQQK